MFKGQSGKPRFKSRKRSKPAFYSRYDRLKAKGNSVYLEKLGWVQTSEPIPESDKYSNPRVSFDGKNWYVSVGFKQKQVKQELTGEIIGIDLGVKELAVCSNGMRFKNINKSAAVRKTEKRLRRLQRKASRKYEMNKEGNRFVKTCNIVKVEMSIRLLHRRLTNIRTNHIHQATSTIAKTKPSAVVMEDLNVRGMMKNRHSDSVTPNASSSGKNGHVETGSKQGFIVFYKFLATETSLVPNLSTEVIIIGAGLAGLTAAEELSKHSIPFVLLEARDRVGGRILSHKEDGIVVDYGAQWVAGKQTRIAGLLQRYGVTTTPAYTEGLAYYAFLDRKGTAKKDTSLLPVASRLDILRLRKQWRKLERGLGRRAPWESASAQVMDAQTLRAWADRTLLTKYGKAYYEAIAEEALCGNLNEFSLLDAVWSSASCGGYDDILTAEERWMPEGAQTLSERMAASFGESVKLNSPVRAIEWSEHQVTVRTDRGSWQGRKAILAMPPAFAGRIQYEPALPYMRDQLTQRMGQGAVIKFFLVYDKPFWREMGLSGEAYIDKGPIRFIMDCSTPGRKEGILTAIAAGSGARDAGRLRFEDRRSAVLRSLSGPFGPEALRPLAYYEKDWMSDPWSRGGYAAHLAPGVLTEFGPALWTPVGPIHWAGTETATEWRSYMEGAVQSGERAAAEVLQAIADRQ